MTDLIARIRVLLTALPTYLVAASAVITIFHEEIASLLPTDAAEAVGSVVVVVLAILAAAVNIVRRVTPVVAAQRGLLPPAGPVIPEVNSSAGQPYGDASSDYR